MSNDHVHPTLRRVLDGIMPPADTTYPGPGLDDYARAHLREVEERERAGWEQAPWEQAQVAPLSVRLSLQRLQRLTQAMREAIEQGRLRL